MRPNQATKQSDLTEPQQLELACRLIERASHLVPQTAEFMRRAPYGVSSALQRSLQYLENLSDFVDERGPDESWYRDYLLIKGEHYQLTEEGWVPADMNTKEATGDDPMEVLDEVNVIANQGV